MSFEIFRTGGDADGEGGAYVEIGRWSLEKVCFFTQKKFR